jgi:hypothetical protein
MSKGQRVKIAAAILDVEKSNDAIKLLKLMTNKNHSMKGET